MKRLLGIAAACTIALLVAPTQPRAQDFTAPGPPWAESPAALLERGLPSSTPEARIQSLGIRWFGLAELSTASFGLGAAWRGARVAIGVSRTGTADLGWSAIGVGGGWADAHAGAAARVVARSLSEAPATQGVEAGAGAWAEAAPGVRLWASAPQLWTDGEAPPLERRLEIGIAARALDLEWWVSRATSPGSPRGFRGEHAAGVALRMGALALWTEVRDQPARGGFGLAVIGNALAVACQADGHPVLGDTWKLGLSARVGRR